MKGEACPLCRAHPALSYPGLQLKAETNDLDLCSIPSVQCTQLGGGVLVAPTGDCTHGPAPLPGCSLVGRQGGRPDTVGLFFLLH